LLLIFISNKHESLAACC